MDIKRCALDGYAVAYLRFTILINRTRRALSKWTCNKIFAKGLPPMNAVGGGAL